MARNSEGEFEMVLGNKQLLSLFFLVVVLFGVFFSLGYMVGRSVGPTPTLAAQPASGEPARSPEPAPPSVETRPSPTPAAPPEAAQAEPLVRFEPERQPPPKETAEAPPPLVVRDIHLQLAAVRVKQDAEALVDALRKKGYAVHLNSQTRDGWHRVIVGPFANERAAQEMKVQLEKDGYRSILKKP
jgi:cell division septation protein DedD